jgi:hypothetical protein
VEERRVDYWFVFNTSHGSGVNSLVVDLNVGGCSNWGDLPISFVLTIAKGAPFSGEGDVSVVHYVNLSMRSGTLTGLQSARGIAYASIFMVVQTLAM